MPDRSQQSTALFGIARNEAPYWEEWFEYHLGLGFERIHLISTDDDFPTIRRRLDNSEFRPFVDLYRFDDFQQGWQIGCYNRFLPNAEQDWVLVIDLDEFLYLPDSGTITNFLERVPDDIGQVQFPWVNLFSNQYVHARTFDVLSSQTAHASDHVKSMVRRRDTTGLGVHSHNVDAKNMLASGLEIPARHKHAVLLRDPSHFRNQPLIVHFASRGHLDVLTRISDHQFFNAKNGELERNRTRRFLEQDADPNYLPTRFLLAEMSRCMPPIDVRIDHLGVATLKSETDVALVQKSFGRLIHHTVGFEGNDNEPIEETFEQRYGLTEKLSGLHIEEYFDLDEYVSSNSQLQYVRRLREKIAMSS